MTDIYGLILAGGQGKRMGNRDKGLIRVSGNSLVQYVINALSPQVGQILISTNQHIDQYQQFGFKVFTDELAGYSGPLAGIQRAMKEISKSQEIPALIILAPCDAPLLPSDLVSRLIVEMSDDGTLAVIPHDGTYLQPLFGLYSTSLLPSLEAYLDSGNRKVTTWVESLNPVVVDFSDKAERFLNINSEEDLANAKKALGH